MVHVQINLHIPFHSVKMKRLEKPMQPADYRRIESELQQQIKQANLTGVMHGDLLTRKGWSTGNFGINSLLQ